MKADLLNIIHSQKAPDFENQKHAAGGDGSTSPNHPTDTQPAPIQPLTTICREPDFRVTKSRKRKDKYKIHQRCFEVVSQFDDEFKKLIEERDEQRHQDHKLVQRLRDENRKEASKVRQNIAEKEKALAEKAILETELRQLKQHLNHSHGPEEGQISWAAIQPFLCRLYSELSVSMHHLRETINTVQSDGSQPPTHR